QFSKNLSTLPLKADRSIDITARLLADADAAEGTNNRHPNVNRRSNADVSGPKVSRARLTASIHRIHALPLPHVRLIEMLVDHFALLLVQFLRVRSRKFIENILDGREHHRSGCLLLPAVEHQLFLLQLLQ